MRQTNLKSFFLAAALAVGGVIVPEANAGVVFTNIVDTTNIAPGHGAFTGFSSTPSISGSNIAFGGYYSGGLGIYTGTVGTVGSAKIVDTTDTAPGHTAFVYFDNAAISGSNIAIYAEYSGGTGIYTGTVGTVGVAKLVNVNDTVPGHTTFAGFGNAAIGGSTVAFIGAYVGGFGIFTGTVGATGTTEIVDNGAAPGHAAFIVPGNPAISGSNVAFFAAYSGGSGIYTGNTGATGATKIVDTTDIAPGRTAFTSFGNTVSISGNNVAFMANYSSGSGIYTGTVGTIGSAKIVDTSDIAPGHTAFTSFGNAAISGSSVAFTGNYAGGSGLYVESTVPGGSVMPLLNTGDGLFGSTLNGLVLSPSGYDGNTIAFEYVLADGRNGIAVATVPEPASLALLALASLAIPRRGRRRVTAE